MENVELRSGYERGDNMIEIIMDGMCDGCQQADLRLECLDIEALGDFGYIKEWRIYCTHQQACEAMRRKMREVNYESN